ncbi:hypothetical protein ASF71_20010 [Deinococcus sp. Leaf326]|nr:hypothetical protein ASF71_20010 [Deinococcus sp. Leaf326]
MWSALSVATTLGVVIVVVAVPSPQSSAQPVAAGYVVFMYARAVVSLTFRTVSADFGVVA